MNIYDFKRDIDKTILDRGHDYYLDGRVIDVFELGKNEYVFEIQGNDDYQVNIGMKENGEVIYSVCDCPYDFGPVCKHEAAAYFELLDRLKRSGANDKETEKSSQQASLHDVLDSLSKEELINIIIDIAKKDATLKNSLMFTYAKGDNQQELEACRKLMEAIVREYTGKEGFINYRDTAAFVSELEEVAEKARETEDTQLALDIALMLLEEAIEAFQYADDSNGDIGFLVRETLGVIGEIAYKSDDQGQQRKVFTQLLDFTEHYVFDGWDDFQLDLIHICFGFADDVIFRKQLSTKIEYMLDKNSSGRPDSYTNESLLQLSFQLIEQYGTEEEAEQFIKENPQYSSFRELLLHKYIQEKNYNKVIQLAKEGEEQDKKLPGLVTNWKQFRYKAYQSLSLKEEQQALAMELFLGGDFDYYEDLKGLASEREVLYTTLKHKLKSRTDWRTLDVFLKLIEEENDLEELLSFVKRNPHYIEKYAEKLSNHSKQEVIEIYKDYIKSAASAAGNRSAYRGVCDKIKEYIKAAGKQEQEELIQELRGLYKKRPAFIDELGKI
jgi:hypothetical protein